MSNNTLAGYDLDRVITSWKAQYGEEARGKKRGGLFYKVSSNPETRQGMYRTLIAILVEQYQYDAADFGELLANRIIEASTFEDLENQKQLKIWKKQAREDWLLAVEDFFPSIQAVTVAAKERIRSASTAAPKEIPEGYQPPPVPSKSMEELYKEVEQQKALEGQGGFPSHNTIFYPNEDLLAGLGDDE